jgi:hypothetical protein
VVGIATLWSRNSICGIISKFQIKNYRNYRTSLFTKTFIKIGQNPREKNPNRAVQQWAYISDTYASSFGN